ncbi:MAG: type II toxin-antitoxin system HicA family toxin [Candidatus Rokuibacteriota bacterium]
MPGLRRLSGREVVSILQRFGFEPVSQRGSHIKLRRDTSAARQTLTVPAPAATADASARSPGSSASSAAADRRLLVLHPAGPAPRPRPPRQEQPPFVLAEGALRMQSRDR